MLLNKELQIGQQIVVTANIEICFQHANEDVEKMILGNKCDVEDKRAVSKERGEMVIDCHYFQVKQISCEMCMLQIAREHGIRFMETSAKANINIESAFYELAQAILTKTCGREQTEMVDRVPLEGGRSDRQSNRCC